MKLIGDGQADDTAAVQWAIDASDGWPVILPPGRFKLTAPIVPRANIELLGCGEGATVLWQSDPAIPVLKVYAAGQDAIFRIGRMTLQGGSDGIRVVPGSNWYIDRASSFRDLRIVSQTHAGILIEAGMIGCSHSGLHVEMPGEYGIHAEGNDLLGSTTWSGMRIAGARTAAMRIKQPPTGSLQLAITIENPVFESNGGPALDLFSSGVVLVNPHFESNGGSPDPQRFPDGVPDICLDSNWPDAVGAAEASCDIHGGVFSSPGAAQFGQASTACRVWANNYSCKLTEHRTFHRDNDRLDCKNHADMLHGALYETTGSVTTIGNLAKFGFYEIAHTGIRAGYQGAQHVSFFDKIGTRVPQQEAHDLPTLLAALKATGLIK